MPTIFGPWQTRSVTVPGHHAANLPQSLTAGYYAHGGNIGASPPGSYPWRNTPARIAASDAAKESTFATSRVVWTQPDLDMAAYPGAAQRREYIEFLCGLRTETTADRVLFGTFYDDYSVDAYLGNAVYGVDPRWLGLVFPIPDPTAGPTDPGAVPLSVAEWAALWNRAVMPGIEYREIDLAGCSVDMHVTFTVVDTSHETGGSPGFVVKLDAGGALSGTYHDAATINPLADIETISGTRRDLPFTDPTWHDAVSGADLGTPMIDSSQVNDVTQPTAAVDGGDEYVVPDSGVWVDGFDPGYDETGIPPGAAPPAVYHGGGGADWYATVRVQIDVTYTITQRFITVTYGTPPMWQRQRIGAVDSPESFASGLVTPQSSPWQGGTL